MCGEEGRKEISMDVARRCRVVRRLQGSGRGDYLLHTAVGRRQGQAGGHAVADYLTWQLAEWEGTPDFLMKSGAFFFFFLKNLCI